MRQEASKLSLFYNSTNLQPSTRSAPPPAPSAPGVPPAPPAPPVPQSESTGARLERETVAAQMSQAALQAAEQYEPPDFANSK